eukprot:c6515_g2_i1.p2 GENE.c6515_g2_i1~~c6515_g2_i1.p2  ORF type:complete len:109 (+),score=24.61 c6515_g2_i1:335-661(+)
MVQLVNCANKTLVKQEAEGLEAVVPEQGSPVLMNLTRDTVVAVRMVTLSVASLSVQFVVLHEPLSNAISICNLSGMYVAEGVTEVDGVIDKLRTCDYPGCPVQVLEIR